MTLRAVRALVGLALVGLSTGLAAQVDGPSCYDAVDRVRRAARDAESEAGSVNQEAFSGDDLRSVNDALDEVASRLSRARAECASDPRPRAVRACQNFQMIARTEGRQKALQACSLSGGDLRYEPQFCEACTR